MSSVISGVPQGSVLGPILWNIKGLIQLPAGVEFLACADDVALIAKGKDAIVLEQFLSVGVEIVINWMAKSVLELAIQKSEAMVITKTRTHNDFRISIGGVIISMVTSHKYLGIYLDQKLNFYIYTTHATAKAGKVASNLARILPNISEAKPRKRRLLAGVVYSILLYGIPIWSEKMS